MENRNKYLWILALGSLAVGSAVDSYGQDNQDKNKDKDKITINKLTVEEVAVDVKEEPLKISGEATLEAANNFGLRRSARTDFTPSLISKEKPEKELIDNICFDASAKLEFEKVFYVQEKKTKGVIEIKADRETLKLGKLFFESGGWAAGIKGNNFGTISVFPHVKALQISWTKQLNSRFKFGFDVEEPKQFKLVPEGEKKDDADEGDVAAKKKKELPIQPRRDLPAASARIEYTFAEKLGCLEVSTLARFMGFHDKDTGKTTYELGYGFNAGAKFNLVPKHDKVVMNVIYGEGIGSYIYDLAKLAKEEPSNAHYISTNRKVKPIRALGGHISWEHRFVPAVRLNLSAGITRILNEDSLKRVGSAYLMGVYGTGNIMYWLTKQTGLGIEYSIGNRTNVNKDNIPAHHLDIMAKIKI